MLLFFKRLRNQLITNGKFQKYLLYAIGEIILVVVGILIALKINNWNNNRVLQANAEKSYLDIKRQILDDKTALLKVKAYNDYYSKAYEYGNNIIMANDRSKVDSLAMVCMALSQFSDFHKGGNIFETLVNSGDLKLLKNDDITSRLQKLEMTYTFANKLEDIHWEIIINELSQELRGAINYSSYKAVLPDKLYSLEIQNIIYESIYLTKAKDSVYRRAIFEIDKLVDLIEVETGSPSGI
ncbi:MAG: hypothetical protein KJO49_06585 [Bacteroidia bacterium]|nr:hypothetical protein [Bacteroidia bacterium]MBT8267611.1 hypothetical protein [Bacteroidia bacterium]NNK71011.1 hypothetical protein [Flavobacteriaceae bacterium]